MNRRWIKDKSLADRMSRFIIVYSYASKALLRGISLTEDKGDGSDLVERGLLTQKELDYMDEHPCWQPHYCLEMLRAILVQVHNTDALVFNTDNKVHGQLFRCFDNTIKDLNQLIGNCVRTSASGLPASYDAITMTSFFLFFTLASFVWSASVFWMLPVIVFCASSIIMLLIVMGTKLVDPFGYDKVDIPMEAFCATIEAQIIAIDKRATSGIMEDFATTTSRRLSNNHELRNSFEASVNIPKLN